MKHFIKAVLKVLDPEERVKLFKLTALDFIISILDIVFLGIMLLVVDFYTKSNAVHDSFISRYFSKHNSLIVITAFFLLFSLKNWLGYRITAMQNHFFFKVASRLSKRNILHYLNDNYLQFINVDSSVQIRKISQQPIEFSNYILINIRQIFSQGMLVLLSVIAILFYHPNLFLLLFVLLMPPILLLAWYIRKKLKNIRASIKITSQKNIQYLQESLAGYVESNLYDRNTFFTERYHNLQEKLNNNFATQQSLQGLPPRMVEVFAILGFLILLTINKFSAGSLGIDLLDIGVFLAASYKIIPGIVKILNSTGQMKAYEFTLTDLLIANKDRSVSKVTDVIDAVKFKDVSFKYKSSTILKKCNLEINSGDFAGISGKSGAGKTTILSLMLGLLDPDSGTISINYKATNSADRQRYWDRISYIKQQPFFINDSILKNICLSDEAPNADKLAEAIAFCGIDSMLSQYPEGINKLITENGKNISGGQRQRIMLARALYHDFDLLILDEPFSEMDEISEKKILTKLAQLAKTGKIILIITHNKAGLAFCNKIIHLDEQA